MVEFRIGERMVAESSHRVPIYTFTLNGREVTPRRSGSAAVLIFNIQCIRIPVTSEIATMSVRAAISSFTAVRIITSR